SNSVYVIPVVRVPPVVAPEPPGPIALVQPTLTLESRLLMRVEFDLPEAVPASPGLKAEAWAVVLKLKFQNNPADDPSDNRMVVTCNFNNDTNDRNGVRLNDPGRAQDTAGNKADDLDSPLDYLRYQPFWFFGPPRFILSFAFSGIQAGPAPPPPRKTGDP